MRLPDGTPGGGPGNWRGRRFRWTACLVVGVGLGANEHEFEDLGETAGLRARAEKLDEGLNVLAGLWSGESFSHVGPYHRVDGARFLPTPVQEPRIPIWVAVSWPYRRPLQRALRWDGGIVVMAEPGPFNTPPEACAAIRAEAPADRVFDLVVANGDPEWDVVADAAEVERYEAAGVTWWLEVVDPWRFTDDVDAAWPLEDMRSRILAGPPGSTPEVIPPAGGGIKPSHA